MDNFWALGAPEFEGGALNEDISCDVCVIGAGIAGLTAAYQLIKSGYDVVILEANKVGGGNSGRSSAIITFAHDVVYNRLLKFHGLKTAKEYYALNSQALQKITDLIQAEGIDCGLSFKDIKITARTKKGLKSIKKESKAYQKIKAQGIEFGDGEITIKNQAVINPYKYTLGLAQAVVKNGGRIFENCRVTKKPKNGAAIANGHSMSAKHFVAATHFPYLRFPGLYFAKLYQHRSHNLVFDYRFGDYVSISADDRGGEYRQADGTHTQCCAAHVRTGRYHHESCFQKALSTAESELKQSLKPVSEFSAQDCITFNLLPIAKRYSIFVKDTYVISGFNKWGFTTSIIAAERINDLITHKKPSKNRVFTSKSACSVFFATANLLALVKEFAGYIFFKGKKIKNIQSGQGAIVRHKGRRLAVFHDGEKLHAFKAVCPHMGCPLHYNKDEKSFDCACHGSRFDASTGQILDNPALKGLSLFRALNTDKQP